MGPIQLGVRWLVLTFPVWKLRMLMDKSKQPYKPYKVIRKQEIDSRFK